MNAKDVRALLDEVAPPAGRADLTNPQKIALAQAHATLLLAEQVRLANAISILDGSAAMVEHDTGARASTPGAKERVKWRNELRAQVREALGI